MAGKKSLIGVLEKFKATLVIAAALVLGYFVISQGNIFIEKNTLVSLAFSISQPANILSYMITHMSIWHMAVNVLSLLLFASIVETTLGSKDVFGIFAFSGTVTVALFAFFNPETILVGASAGVWGIMSSAFILDFRKALALLGIVLILFLAVFPTATLAVETYQASLNQENFELGEELNKAVISGEEEKIVEAVKQKEIVETEVEEFSASKRFASEAAVDPLLHTYAGALGIAYLTIFRRKETLAAIKKQKLAFFGKKQSPGSKN